MRIECNNEDFLIVKELFSKFDRHRSRYVELNWVELTTRQINIRGKLVDCDCFLVNGKTSFDSYIESNDGQKVSAGTRYVYGKNQLSDDTSDTTLFNHLKVWFRDKKLEKIGI